VVDSSWESTVAELGVMLKDSGEHLIKVGKFRFATDGEEHNIAPIDPVHNHVRFHKAPGGKLKFHLEIEWAEAQPTSQKGTGEKPRVLAPE
jgi:hypothetical protein